MTPQSLWQRYARIWTSAPATRVSELEACLAETCVYCDINGIQQGREALSRYMGGFQESVKNANFEILSVLHHHDCMLAEWRLVAANGAVLQTGRSFATTADDGRLQAITGFFDA